VISGKEQVFVAPGDDDDEPVDESVLPWVYGRGLHFPLEHWELLLDEAGTVDRDMADLLRSASGVVAPETSTDIELAPARLDALIEFLKRFADHLSGRRQLAVPIPPEIEYVLPMSDYAEMVRLVRRVLEEARDRRRPFQAWTDW